MQRATQPTAESGCIIPIMYFKKTQQRLLFLHWLEKRLLFLHRAFFSPASEAPKDMRDWWWLRPAEHLWLLHPRSEATSLFSAHPSPVARAELPGRCRGQGWAPASSRARPATAGSSQCQHRGSPRPPGGRRPLRRSDTPREPRTAAAGGGRHVTSSAPPPSWRETGPRAPPSRPSAVSF